MPIYSQRGLARRTIICPGRKRNGDPCGNSVAMVPYHWGTASINRAKWGELNSVTTGAYGAGVLIRCERCHTWIDIDFQHLRFG